MEDIWRNFRVSSKTSKRFKVGFKETLDFRFLRVWLLWKLFGFVTIVLISDYLKIKI